jgi:endosialidase-like protein
MIPSKRHLSLILFLCAISEAALSGAINQEPFLIAGPGIMLNGKTVSVNFKGTGVRNSAARSDHNHNNAYWKLGGNSGTSAFTNFLGTLDYQSLELRVNGIRALRLEPNDDAYSVNIIGGSRWNVVGFGVKGATIAGGGGLDAGGFNLINRVDADFGSVSGGQGNLILAALSTIAGGSYNVIGRDSESACISGGYHNRISTNSSGSSIGGGSDHEIKDFAHASHIGGGSYNVIGSDSSFSTIGGGLGNETGADYATVPGGSMNLAAGYFSFAAGRNAKALHQGTFVWGDSQETDVASTANDQFVARAYGGTRFFSGSVTGVELFANSGSWSSLSDKATKTNVMAVDNRNLLENLLKMPIRSWTYKGQSTKTRHIGPMAQDFHAAFGFGEDDRHISNVDADGVALAAIQGLSAKFDEALQKKEMEIEKLNRRISDLEALLHRGPTSAPNSGSPPAHTPSRVLLPVMAP